jgi:hypothetical protein
MHNAIVITVTGKIGDQEKQIILRKNDPFTDVYDIMIDKNFEGQVLKYVGRWKVYPIQKSWLNGKDCSMILQAVLNFEESNP